MKPRFPEFIHENIDATARGSPPVRPTFRVIFCQQLVQADLLFRNEPATEEHVPIISRSN